MQQTELKTNTLLVKIHATYHIFIHSFFFVGRKGYGTKLQWAKTVSVGPCVGLKQVVEENANDNAVHVFTLLRWGVAKASLAHGTTQTNRCFAILGQCISHSKPWRRPLFSCLQIGSALLESGRCGRGAGTHQNQMHNMRRPTWPTGHARSANRKVRRNSTDRDRVRVRVSACI